MPLRGSKRFMNSRDLNIDQLVTLSVLGEITTAVWPANRVYRIGADGIPRVLPGTGGICYSHQIGDSAVALKGDHVEPGVTIKNSNGDANSALNTLACVGNEAVVVSGDAKGKRGVVIGKHGGVEHVMIDFPLPVLEKLTIGDKIQIRARGVGLEIAGSNGVLVSNCDPELLAAWGIQKKRDSFEVPVTHVLPAKLMGSGLGAVSIHSGDYDIQLFDEKVNREHNLGSLRFGDVVAITDADHTFGRRFLGGAVSVGVIVHSRSDMSGHGPGVTTLLTSQSGKIKPVVRPDANIGKILKIGRWRKG
jgi:hypothetical protein